MPLRHESRLTTRLADLDTQRHVTSRTYEAFAYQARQELLAARGYGLQRLADEGIRLRPLACYVRFQNQQMADAELIAPAICYPGEDGLAMWDHPLRTAAGDPVCRIVYQTRFEDSGSGAPLPLLQADAEAFPEPGIFPELTPFQDQCRQTATVLRTLFSDRGFDGDYPPAGLWRIFEEGRWIFGATIGLTMDLIRSMDTTLFFMGGVFYYHEAPPAGVELQVRTWLESIDRIRVLMRQDVVQKDGGRIYMSGREEHLVVSLSRSRPRKPPAEMLNLMEAYLASPA